MRGGFHRRSIWKSPIPSAVWTMCRSPPAKRTFVTRLQTALVLDPRTQQSFLGEHKRPRTTRMGMIDYDRRSAIPEIMDDLFRPRREFDEAYRDLARVNRWLGGIRAIERFLPTGNLLILDVAAGACDVGESISRHGRRVIVLDRNPEGLRLAKRSSAVTADALEMPFPDQTFDVVMASLFFHHLSDDECVRVLKSMWRMARRRVLVNDLHRHPIAYLSIRTIASFSKSIMFRHDGPVSVLRAFKAEELLAIARRAGIPARVHRSFPYRLVMVADK